VTFDELLTPVDASPRVLSATLHRVYMCMLIARDRACLVCVGILYKVQTHTCRRVHRNVAVAFLRAAIMFLASNGDT